MYYHICTVRHIRDKIIHMYLSGWSTDSLPTHGKFPRNYGFHDLFVKSYHSIFYIANEWCHISMGDLLECMYVFLYWDVQLFISLSVWKWGFIKWTEQREYSRVFKSIDVSTEQKWLL